MDGDNNNYNNYWITTEVKDILQLYDENDLLGTIPNDYKVDSLVLKLYAKRCEPTQSIELNLTESHINFLTTLAENANAPLSLLFNFLVETVADCGKINTRRVNRALNFYYDAAANNPTLHKKILDAFADSIFYSNDRGLNDEDVAKFLIISEERTKYNGPGIIPSPLFPNLNREGHLSLSLFLTSLPSPSHQECCVSSRVHLLTRRLNY